MKNIHKKNTDSHSNSNNSNKTTDIDLESIALELDQIAKAKLPNGCLNGLLKGKEAEIRQDALLLTLRWFTKHPNHTDWISARSVAHALRYMKMRYIHHLSKQRLSLIFVGEDPALLDLIDQESQYERPMSNRSHASTMVLQAIAQATRSGRISNANANIVLMVLHDGYSVAQVADKKCLTRGAVYQQINRVRAVLPSILDHIEEPNYL